MAPSRGDERGKYKSAIIRADMDLAINTAATGYRVMREKRFQIRNNWPTVFSNVIIRLNKMNHLLSSFIVFVIMPCYVNLEKPFRGCTIATDITVMPYAKMNIFNMYF